MTELPVTQLAERIQAEMDDNPALETTSEPAEYSDYSESPESPESSENTDDFDSQHEREERQSALDDALAGIGRDDEELPVYHGGMSSQDEREDYGDNLPRFSLGAEKQNQVQRK